MKKILILEDEENIRSFVVINLQRAGYITVEAATGQEALDKLREHPDVDVAVLDIMLPDIDGFEVCRRIRATSKRIGIIMLTARTQEMDKVTGLMNGADDYVTKPFNPLELIARVKSQLRRYTMLGSMEKKSQNTIQNGGLEINLETHEVFVDGEEKKLTPVEFGILSFLAENAGRVFSIHQIYEAVWKEPSYNAENTVSVHIRRIREKIEINAKEPKYVKVVWGVGYKIEKHV